MLENNGKYEIVFGIANTPEKGDAIIIPPYKTKRSPLNGGELVIKCEEYKGLDR